MRTCKTILPALLISGLLTAPGLASAAEHGHGRQAVKEEKKIEKPKPYPLSTCLVSGEKFGGAMGEPYVFAHQGREIKLCCQGCLKEFNKNTAKYLAKWDAAAKKVKPYPLKTCVVSDQPLGGDMGEPYVFIHEGREIKLCCQGCLKEFNKAPAKYLKKLDAAKKG
jgi:YHS domain-containing protein